MDFKKTAMGMLAAAVAVAPVVMAQGNGVHGGVHGSVHGSTGTATHSGPLFTGIVCGNENDEGSFFSEFVNQHGHEYWTGGGSFSDGYNGVGWRMQTNNIHPSTWSVLMNLYNTSDEASGVDTGYFAWYLTSGSGFIGEYIYLDSISNSEPTCVTARSLSNGYTQYNYNSRFDPGVGSGTKYASGIYFQDFGQEGFDDSSDEFSWEDYATAPVIGGFAAVPDLHNTPSIDCNGTHTDSDVGS